MLQIDLMNYHKVNFQDKSDIMIGLQGHSCEIWAYNLSDFCSRDFPEAKFKSNGLFSLVLVISR